VNLLNKHEFLFVCEKLLHVVAFSCRACLAMKPLAEGASVNIEFSGCFRYIDRARGSQERDRLIDRSHGCGDTPCERTLLMSREIVFKSWMCTS
jgi:hypothetical protein